MSNALAPKAIAVLALALLARAPRAQDPPPPPGGFPIVEVLNQLYTYADSYRTRYDLRYPDPALVAPPPTGWPCLLLVHGFSGARGEFILSGEGASYARHGYVSVAYDVRGQGETRTLNTTGGSTFTGGAEKADMAELFHAIEARLGPTMDLDRLCIMGVSQGGEHSWAAAAWSERQMPQPRGAITHFPRLTVACPRAASGNIAELLEPDGNAFSGNFTRVWFQTSAKLLPSFQTTMRDLFLRQDFAGLAALLQNDPWRQDRFLLPSSRVPVLLQLSWDDYTLGENAGIDVFNAMPAATERMAYATTGNHRSPLNTLETANITALTERWLDHFAKGYADEIAQQSPFLLANLPAVAAVYTNPASVLQLRQATAYPATGLTAPTTLYLRQAGALSAQPPSGAEPPDAIVHQVPGTFTPTAWVQTLNEPTQVMAAVPLSSATYRGDPLPADQELIGRAVAHVHVDSTAPNLQVGVALFDEDPSGARRYVAGGYRCVRGRAPGTAQYDVTLRGTCYTFPAGHRLVVAVENHVWHRPVGISELRTVPYFASYAFDCLHDGADASSIDLPLTPPRLGCRAAAVSVSQPAGGAIALPIDGAPLRAGGVYAVLASLSGTVPGFPFLGAQVPINFDALTQLGLMAPGVPPFGAFVGVLDASGRASASFAPAPGQLPAQTIGARLSFAAVAFAPAGAFSASSASQVTIAP